MCVNSTVVCIVLQQRHPFYQPGLLNVRLRAVQHSRLHVREKYAEAHLVLLLNCMHKKT